MRDRYFTLLDDIVARTLKGQIAAKEQVYELLKQGVELGSGELFERCLAERIAQVQATLAGERDELKQAKALRSSRALKTIQGEWLRWQQNNQTQALQSIALRSILEAESDTQLTVLLQHLDPNRDQPLTPSQILELAQQLDPTVKQDPQAQQAQQAQQARSGLPGPESSASGFGFGFGAGSTGSSGAGSGSGMGFGFAAPAAPRPSEPAAPPPAESPAAPPVVDAIPAAETGPDAGTGSMTGSVTGAAPKNPTAAIALGLLRGIRSWQALENDLLAWVYESDQSLGFGQQGARGPCASWAKRLQGFPAQFFQAIAQGQSSQSQATSPTTSQTDRARDDSDPADLSTLMEQASLQDWIQLAVLIQRIQQGLVSWFEKQAYDPQAGPKLAIATYMTFASLWGSIAQGLKSPDLAQASFQMALQLLRNFAQKPYFPLYGGIYASLSGRALRSALDYLDQPLKQVGNTQEKARILTLIGHSHQIAGHLEPAARFHQAALDIASQAGDVACQMANLNHLSRLRSVQKDYDTAIGQAQRALVLARQNASTKRDHEANALTNLGYAEVMATQQRGAAEAEDYERAITYLQQGLQLAEREGDRTSQALAALSLGKAQRLLDQAPAAIASLEAGLLACQATGNLALLGQTYAELAETYRAHSQPELAIAAGAIGLYLLYQINAPEWRRSAGLLVVLRTDLGPEAWAAALQNQRSRLLPIIGVEGLESIPDLLETYWQDA